MKHIRHLAALALIMTAAASLPASADEPLKRTDLVQGDIDIPGHEAAQVRVDFAPGVLAPKHTHPGEEIAYVLKGTIVYELEGRDPVTLTEGQSLFIPSGVPHSARNIGKDTASELATYIVRKGETVFVPVK
jgi:quercetin dioxygenase-like cupin family protein